MRGNTPCVAFAEISKISFVPEIANTPHVAEVKFLPTDIHVLLFLSRLNTATAVVPPNNGFVQTSIDPF